MSAIRERAAAILDAALPGETVIASNGALASTYTDMTGYTQKRLETDWAKGKMTSGCNPFVGWFASKLGATVNLGGFDLHGLAAAAGKANAWVPSRSDRLPQYGDLLRHATYHVDVALDFEGPLLWRAAGGQGPIGRKGGYDTIKRVRGTKPYQPVNLVGWIDIDLFFGPGGTTGPSANWFGGWWQVWDGGTYYYYFGEYGEVSYVTAKPLRTAPAPAKPVNRGRYQYDAGENRIVVDWDGTYGESTRETFWNAIPATRSMNANSDRYSPLVATRY